MLPEPKGPSGSLAGDLAIALPHLAPSWATRAASARLMQAAARSPAVSGFGIECRLGDADRLDLIVRFMPHEYERAHALGVPPLPCGSRATLFVELDLPGEGRSGTALFLGPGDSGSARPVEGTAAHDILALADWLFCGRAPRGIRRFLVDRHAVLGPDLWVGYLGRFPDREPQRLRMTLSGLTCEGLRTFLSTFGAPATLVPGGLDKAFMGLPVRLVIQLEMEDDFTDILGIEISPRDSQRWMECLSCLAPFAGINEMQAAQLVVWRGVEETARGALARRLNHVKLVCRPGLQPQCKVYLYVARLRSAQQSTSMSGSLT